MKARGFTLVELISTLAVLAIAAGLAAPACGTLAEATRVRTATSELTTALATARIEAVARNRPVTVCPSLDARTCRTDLVWDAGWIVFADPGRTGQPISDDAVIRRFAATKALRARATPGRPYVHFQPSGWSPGTNVSIRLCDRRNARLLAAVVVNNAGRARVERPTRETACPFAR